MEQPSELTSGSLWNEVAGRLRGALNDSTYRTWFGEVRATEERDALVLAVPNDFTREWIEGHFLDLIRAAARDASGRDRVVRLVIDDSPAETGEEQPQREAVVGLNPKYTFDLFVIGSSNRFAHAAALAVAETRRGRTTRSSSTARPASARPTCYRRSRTTSPSTRADFRCGT